jgi:hypothetical protein
VGRLVASHPVHLDALLLGEGEQRREGREHRGPRLAFHPLEHPEEMAEILLRVLLARRGELGVSLAHERFEHARLHTHRELGLIASGIAVRGEPVGQLGELHEQIT